MQEGCLITHMSRTRWRLDLKKAGNGTELFLDKRGGLEVFTILFKAPADTDKKVQALKKRGFRMFKKPHYVVFRSHYPRLRLIGK
ncbi:hypothetical protein PsorP6_000087 [Peronosclerospora sorghi]|uniref:Uncharacterized protein n=1 Tax=Peronosclerospora sorghi TaxID=230839 RepID=A0ACC0WQR5_9STRA|nr:hypothetical protein PsorP6_000087 [Peronosclerospora sorghi]